MIFNNYLLFWIKSIKEAQNFIESLKLYIGGLTPYDLDSTVVDLVEFERNTYLVGG